MERKLTAILSADVKGYSRLMGEDEVATISMLTAYREVMASLIQRHRGRVVDMPGDNLLAEFASVVDAVHCAVEIQRELKARNAEVPDHRKMEFRIGVNLGDVVVDGERIYGDGVNIAARVEGLAEGGGICIAGTAYDQVRNKLALGYESLGEHTVKNIAQPVRAYRVLTAPEAAGTVIEKRPPITSMLLGDVRARPGRWAALAAVGVLLVGAGATGIWNFYLRTSSPPGLELPDKPSIAVLPFVNMSGDPKQEYFADGMTEDLITDLSRFPELFVIARNSTFTYKGKPVKVQQVSRELGVRYVVEGSVRKAGDRVRITAQLVDATTGRHVWAERYERDLKNVFGLQDEITRKILAAVGMRLTVVEQDRRWRRGTRHPEANDYRLRALENFRHFTKEGNAQARQLWEKAIQLDSQYATAFVGVGWTHLMDVIYGWSASPPGSLQRAYELAQQSLALEDNSDAHALLGNVYLWGKRQHEQAIAEAERAITLNPNAADPHALYGLILNFAGRPEDAIGAIKRAMRLNPFHPDWYLLHLAFAYRLTGDYQAAIPPLEEILARSPHFQDARRMLAATYARVGREDEARAEAAEFLRRSPKFSLKRWAKMAPFKDQADLERNLDDYRKVGLPD